MPQVGPTQTEFDALAAKVARIDTDATILEQRTTDLTTRVVALESPSEPPPDPIDCVLGDKVIVSETPVEVCQPGPPGSIQNGKQRIRQVWNRPILVEPEHGGDACGPTLGEDIIERACVYVPPPDPPPPSGNPHARFDALRALSTCFLARSLRTQAELNAAVDEGQGGISHRYTYDFAGDPYPQKQDAAKLIFPSTLASIEIGQQLILHIQQTSGTFLKTWDTWYGPEWMKTSHGGKYDFGAVPQYIHKEFQCGFERESAGGKGTIFYEVQQRYRKGAAGNVGPIGHRLYNGLAAGMVSTSGAPYGPGTAAAESVFLPPAKWVRYVVELRLNQDASAFTDWQAFTGQALAPGLYHMASTWMLTPTTGPIRILFRVPMHRFKGDSPSIIRNKLSAFWFEHNTSSPVGALTAPAILYARNFVCLKGYALPAVPETDALIFQRPPA